MSARPAFSSVAEYLSALAPFANAKGNLSFPLDEPMPMLLVARVAKALAKQYARKPRPKHAGATKRAVAATR